MKHTFLILLAVISGYSIAHPHMFIDTEMEVRLNESCLEGVEITWYFDPMFTAAITSDFDTNGDKRFNDAETAHVFENAFTNLENSNYFTFLTVGQETLSPTCIEDFSVFLQNGKLVYKFFCPFNISVPGGVFRVAIYDGTYYCDILYREGSPVTLTGPGSTGATFVIEQNEDVSITYGGNVSVSRAGTTYSGTAYPQQLVVQLCTE